MRSCWLCVLTTLILLPVARAAAPEPTRWLTDYEEARKQGARTGKPLFVVFRCPH
jgi:hypothetical protein